MSQMNFATEGVLVVFTSAFTSLIIANWKERLWLKAKKSEDLYYKTEQLFHAFYNLFRNINTVQDAVAKLHNVNGLANIESRMLDLKIQVGIYFPGLEGKFKVVLSATSTAYDALERVADAHWRD